MHKLGWGLFKYLQSVIVDFMLCYLKAGGLWSAALELLSPTLLKSAAVFSANSRLHFSPLKHLKGFLCMFVMYVFMSY